MAMESLKEGGREGGREEGREGVREGPGGREIFRLDGVPERSYLRGRLPGAMYPRL